MSLDVVSLALSQKYTAETMEGAGAIKGDKGDPGVTGPKGDTGATPDIQVGNVVTLGSSESATVTRQPDSTDENPIFDFGIPKGKDGTSTASDTTFDSSGTELSANNVQDAIVETFTSVSNGKSLVASAITDKGVSTDSDATFSTMATNISNIRTSDGIEPGWPPSMLLDPEFIYQTHRPRDWLPMPEPQDNEIYLLFHIPAGRSSLIGFNVTCSGGPYTVELGTVQNGEFQSVSSRTCNSGQPYTDRLIADDWGNLTATGMKQVMIKVSAATILTWITAPSSEKNTSTTNFSHWNIVEIVCRLPSATQFRCGGSSSTSVVEALTLLKFFAWFGDNNVTNSNYTFNGCTNLLAVRSLDTSHATTMTSMFRQCNSLLAIPPIDTSKVTNMNNMFYNCRGLTKIPPLNTSKATSMDSMLNGAVSLLESPLGDTSKVTNMTSIFSGCTSMLKIGPLDTSRVTNLTTGFAACDVLHSLKFNPDVQNWVGYTISINNCALDHDALVELFESLPTVTTARTLTITGNPGTSSLTDEEKAIVAGKNWTLNM